jgi:type IV secretory pathway TrbL component
MSIKLNYIAPLLAAGAAAVAIVAAPAANAAVTGAIQAACSSATPGTSCVSAGNAQINDSLAPNFLSQDPIYSQWGPYSHGGRGGGHR